MGIRPDKHQTGVLPEGRKIFKPINILVDAVNVAVLSKESNEDTIYVDFIDAAL